MPKKGWKVTEAAKAKRRATMLARYGTETPPQNKGNAAWEALGEQKRDPKEKHVKLRLTRGDILGRKHVSDLEDRSRHNIKH